MGVVYKLTPNSVGGWTYNLLHTFAGGNDGSYPQVGDFGLQHSRQSLWRYV